YDEIDEKLESPEFRPQALFERFGIEVLATTDGADDMLEQHVAIGRSDLKGRVIPTFRPDAVFRLAAPGWRGQIESLSRAFGAPIDSGAGLIRALEKRRAFFKRRGAVATDHGVLEPYTEAMSADDFEELFRRGIAGEATVDDQRRFEGHLLMEMGRMSVEDG